MFRAHHTVCTTVSFSKNNCNFWNSSLTVSVKKFSTVKDDSTILLLSTRKEARYVYKGNKRDVECVAETYETSSFS